MGRGGMLNKTGNRVNIMAFNSRIFHQETTLHRNAEMISYNLLTVLTLFVLPLCSASSCMFRRISTGGEATNTTYGINSDVFIDFKACKITKPISLVITHFYQEGRQKTNNQYIVTNITAKEYGYIHTDRLCLRSRFFLWCLASLNVSNTTEITNANTIANTYCE